MAEFVLAPDKIKGLQELVGQPCALERLQVTKDYAGRFEVLFPDGLFPAKLHPQEIDAICNGLPQPTPPVGDEFRKFAEECRAEAIRLAHEGRFSELAELRREHDFRLTVRSNQNPQHQNERNFRNTYLPKLAEVSRKLQDTRTIQQRAHEFVIERLPTFVYTDEYRSFSGTAKLDVVKRRKDQKDLPPADETFMTILALAELDFESEYKKAGDNSEEGREERQYGLSDAEATLNNNRGTVPGRFLRGVCEGGVRGSDRGLRAFALLPAARKSDRPTGRATLLSLWGAIQQAGSLQAHRGGYSADAKCLGTARTDPGDAAKPLCCDFERPLEVLNTGQIGDRVGP